MTRLLFIGEGAGDVGAEEPGASARDIEYPGDLVAITQRILHARAVRPEAVRFQVEAIHWLDVKTRGKRRREQQPRGFAAKLGIFLQQWTGKVDGAVALVDGEKAPQDRLKQLQDGRDRAASEGAALSQRCAVGVAIQEIEAWLLADEEARCCGFGDSVGRRPLGSQPEEIEDPKSMFLGREGEARAAASRLAPGAVRKAIADQLRVEEVARRCPRGFAPFKREVETQISPLFEPGGPRSA